MHVLFFFYFISGYFQYLGWPTMLLSCKLLQHHSYAQSPLYKYMQAHTVCIG